MQTTSQEPWSGLCGATRLSDNRRFDYAYDAFDRRVARFERNSSGTTLNTDVFVLDGWETIAVYRNNSLNRRVLPGMFMDQPLLIQPASGGPFYPYYDLLGNVAGTVTGSGGGTHGERYEYDVYGNAKVFNASGTLVCDQATTTGACNAAVEFGFNGQPRDPETGLYYYRNRYYSPRIRTFLSIDPAGFGDSYDPWQYVGGDPLNRRDPLGLRAVNHGIGRGLLGAYDGPMPDECGSTISQGLCDWVEDRIRRQDDALDKIADHIIDIGQATGRGIKAVGRGTVIVAAAIGGCIIGAASAAPEGVAAGAAAGGTVAGPAGVEGGAALGGVVAGIGGCIEGGAVAGGIAIAAVGASDGAGKLPKPPRGRGSVPPDQRDPKRYFADGERAVKRQAQGGQCANGCGTQIDASNSVGHHKVRHADGGPTTPANHAEVCVDCHDELHAKEVE